jgi:hypothetical protein
MRKIYEANRNSVNLYQLTVTIIYYVGQFLGKISI